MDRDEQLVSDLTVRRPERMVAYSFFTASGVCSMAFQSQLVREQVGPAWTMIWAGCMFVSAALALYGSVTDKWVGEYAGLPLLISVLGLYGISAVAAADSTRPSAILAYGLLVIGFAVLLFARWKDVRRIKKAGEQRDPRDTSQGE